MKLVTSLVLLAACALALLPNIGTAAPVQTQRCNPIAPAFADHACAKVLTGCICAYDGDFFGSPARLVGAL